MASRSNVFLGILLVLAGIGLLYRLITDPQGLVMWILMTALIITAFYYLFRYLSRGSGAQWRRGDPRHGGTYRTSGPHAHAKHRPSGRSTSLPISWLKPKPKKKSRARKTKLRLIKGNKDKNQNNSSHER